MNQKIEVHHFNNGFDLIMIDKPDFVSEFATVMINYGSADLNETELGHAGVAHFLEHKLFTKKSGDIALQFEALGADVNAATSTTKTMYFANFIDHEFQNLDLLFDLVANPFFTAENVEKERQIITQELLMYQDNPNFALNQAVMELMYPKSALGIDIGGTVTSVGKITPEILTQTLNSNYQAAKMKMVISSHQKMSDVVEKITKRVNKLPSNSTKIFAAPFDEETLVTKEKTIHGLVSMPKIAIGLKFDNTKNVALPNILQEYLVELMLESKFNTTTKWFNDRYEKGILQQEVDTEVSFEKAGNYAKLFAQAQNIDQLTTDILAELADKKLDRESFDLKKKGILAQSIRAVDSVSSFAFAVGELSFDGVDYFDVVNELQQLDFATYENFIEEIMKSVQIVVVKLLPEE